MRKPHFIILLNAKAKFRTVAADKGAALIFAAKIGHEKIFGSLFNAIVSTKAGLPTLMAIRAAVESGRAALEAVTL